ncbi:MAG: GNAT family N-acetyltransferase [Acholeplasmataceae bacterium]|nr:GNAT family N-acetyltransferase [Acholeplasmataceae bacterium]
MVIKKLEKKDYQEIKSLWDNNRTESFVYKALDEQSFNKYFIKQADNYQVFSFKAVEGKKIVGFVSGVLYLERNTFYLTMILVDQRKRSQGYGTKLFEALENVYLNNELVNKVEIIFLNPINLRWIIPKTETHEHPNSPGVDLSSFAYLFFINHGFRDYIYQNSYYRNIQNYDYNAEIKSLFVKLKTEAITVGFFDVDKHYGLKELMLDLKNEAWEKEILSHVDEYGVNNTLLVALEGNKAIGFTGPLRVEVSGRGYFAGIGVHSDYRGKGIGKILFAGLCYELKNLGATYMSLFTAKNNPARRIYEREDFKVVKSWANMRKEIRR